MLIPLYIDVRVVVTKSFARIHTASLITAGILHVTFENADDYGELNRNDAIADVFAGMDSDKCPLSTRQRAPPTLSFVASPNARKPSSKQATCCPILKATSKRIKTARRESPSASCTLVSIPPAEFQRGVLFFLIFVFDGRGKFIS